MQLFATLMGPRPAGDGSYVLSSVVGPETQLPLLDAAADTGKFVAAIIAHQDKFEGKVVLGATKIYTFEEVAGIISKSTGKTVKFQQIPPDVLRMAMPHGADELIDMLTYFQNFGYYGAQTEEMVNWAAKNARGQLTTFEDFAAANIHLD